LLMLSAFVYKYGPILIFLEDLHLFDVTSLQLVAEAVRNLPYSCLLVVSRRPNAGIFQPPTSTQVLSPEPRRRQSCAGRDGRKI